MLGNFKINTAKNLFTNAINKAINKYKTKSAVLIIESDEDFNPKFILYNDNGYVLDENKEKRNFEIKDLLNIFDNATLSAFKGQFDLNEEISSLIKKFCHQYSINPLSVSIMFQIKSSDKKAYPTLYNGSQKVKEVGYDELFEDDEEEIEDEN